MVSSLLAVGIGCAFHAAFVPQLDYSFVPPPHARPPFYVNDAEVRLASGAVETFHRVSAPPTAEQICDAEAREFERGGWAIELNGLRLTLLDFKGDPVVGIRTQATGIDKEGNRVELRGPVVRWVRRTPPRPFVTTSLFPGPAGAGTLGRTAAHAFVAAVTTVAAPELDFGALPDGKDRPQVYSVWVLPLLASGDYEDKAGCALRIWANKHAKEVVLGQCARGMEHHYSLQYDATGLRMALLEYVWRGDDEALRRDRVVGLAVESNGPPPAIRWALRPEVRDALNRK